MNVKERICKNLKQARKDKKFTQEKMGKILNMKQTIYSRYETGKLEMNYALIEKVCIILEITPNDLFEIK